VSATENFRAAMRAAGLEFAGEIFADCKLHRFKAGGDKARNSWFILFPGNSVIPAAGVFGCWKRGIKETWHDGARQLSQADWNHVRAQWREADEIRKKAERQRQGQAKKTAAWILQRAKLLTAHAYLATKGVRVCGEVREYRGALVLPLRDMNGELHSLQFIGADGEKRFLSGGKISGCYFMLADKADGALVIVEGYATGASVHEATGFATVCAMNCGNVPSVAEAVRELWPQREIIICADNDAFTTVNDQPKNPGLDAAAAAAKKIHAKLAVPQFSNMATKLTDFNDLHALAGLTEVRKQIKGAIIPTENDEDVFVRLAALPVADYDRVRESEAEALGVRVSTLDNEIQHRRKWTSGSDSTLQGREVNLPDVEPWPEPVNGAEVLSEVAENYSGYVALPPGAADALALWTAHAHCFELFEISPRLNVTSPEKGCGKTVLLDVIKLKVPRPLPTENLTAAVLFRVVEARKPVLLADEYDSWLRDSEELRGLLNAGHRRGGQALRCEGDSHEVRAFNVFGPAVLSGIGALPGTLHDRSIVIPLQRAKPGEIRERFDSRHVEKETELCRKLARFVAYNAACLETCDPKLPDGAYNRLADNWRPLFAIAEAAGGDWPQRAAHAFTKLTSREDSDAQGIGTALLADIADTFTAAGVDKLPSAEIVEALAKIEGREWAEWGRAKKPISTNQLAKLLRRFGIMPRAIRICDETPRGYLVSDFREAFDRYLPPSPTSGCNTATTPENIGDSRISEPQHETGMLHPGNEVFANNHTACCGVAVQKTGKLESEALLL
jgi:putative DNA primase/helicase